MLYSIYAKVLLATNFESTSVEEGLEKKFSSINPHSITIESSVDELSTIARVIIPIKNSIVKEGQILYTPLAGGMPIQISVGAEAIIEVAYFRDFFQLIDLEENKKNIRVFLGYLTGIKALSEGLLELSFEDKMYLFKKKRFALSQQDTTLEALLNEILDQTKRDVDRRSFYIYQPTKLSLGNIRTERVARATDIFLKLKDEFGLFIYFKNVFERVGNSQIINTRPALIAGLKYDLELRGSRYIPFIYPYTTEVAESSAPRPLDFEGEGVLSDYSPIISIDNLEYRRLSKTEDVVVVGTSLSSTTNNQNTIGTINGTTILVGEALEDAISNRAVRLDIKIPDIKEQDDLRSYVLETFNNYPDRGFTGSFTTFGEPLVSVGDRVSLRVNSARSAGSLVVTDEVYYVDKVSTTVNPNVGFIQEITLGAKINDLNG